MTDTHQHIPLHKLVHWEGNVRKVAGADTGLAELAASINAHGVLQSLVVRDAGRGRYAVIAGGRRLQALSDLAKAGTISAKAPVPCHIVSKDTNATEISLAENALREQMHPADEFEAFRKLADEGMPLSDIAARFGVTETVVKKRLKLARVSPQIVEAYRKGDLLLEHVMAFAVSDDHAAQERLWAERGDWNLHPEGIRDALTEGEIDASDRRVIFVGLAAYEKAGGETRRDLFSQGDHGVFILDAVLLETLVMQKLSRAAKTVRKEGWKWVELSSEFDYSEWSDCESRYGEPAPLSSEEQTELAELEAEAETLREQSTDEARARFDEVTDRIDELNDREDVWAEETRAIAGAVVYLDHRGRVDVRRGFVRPGDIPDAPEEAEAAEGEPKHPGERPFPPTLIEDLTAQKSAAISAVLMDNTHVALAAVVHAMGLPIFYGHAGDSVLQLSASPQSMKRVTGSKACEVLATAREAWESCIPGSAGELWSWCLGQDQATLLGMLAFCAAGTVDAIKRKTDRADCDRLGHAHALATALDLDITRWFTPTANNFFSRLSKAQIIGAIEKAKGASGAPAWLSLKKSELASVAEGEVAGTGWVPPPLRAF